MMCNICGDGFMDFIDSPKSKILKIKKLKSRRFGSWLCFLPQVKGGGEEKLWRLALSKGPNRTSLHNFSSPQSFT
jgi:hypothetical protein